VGVMVLNLQHLPLLTAGPIAGQIVGVHIAGKQLRLDGEHPAVQLQIRDERAVGRLGVEVP